MTIEFINHEKRKEIVAKDIRSLSRYVDGEGYKIFPSDAIIRIHGYMDANFKLTQRNKELEQRVKELEEEKGIK